MENIRAFLKRKDVIISAHRYGIDAMGAMAQGAVRQPADRHHHQDAGPADRHCILGHGGRLCSGGRRPGHGRIHRLPLHAPQLVLFSLIAAGGAANELGGAGGPLAVYLIAIAAAEIGKLVSKETKVDILVTRL